MTFTEFETHLGYSFNDKKLLVQALTHKSFLSSLKERTLDSNERLEFLGDAVLDLCMSDILMTAFPESAEGDLTKKRAALVNESTLSEIGQSLGLDNVMLLGKFEKEAQLNKNPRLLSSCFEALLGALYKDGGYTVCFTILDSVMQKYIEMIGRGDFSYDDYKTKLQEKIQKKYRSTPDYLLVSTCGPEHQKTFEVEVQFQGKSLARASSKSKKQAEQLAAQIALEIHNDL